ncbi:unnamed protein product [Psylliodes chrysocephalus]|uniref:RRM domain-containing protein n=1 Tax=Psylliodes chrysocephalus TaxID=3402493 RepID=A0A9P0D857_9CUCU|nr:unnamed protein product [Psylliodes chrysocephala]
MLKMNQLKNAEVLSLDTTKQKEVVKQTKKLKKKIKEGTIAIKETKKPGKFNVEQTRGLIYISHLPHGFYEDELKNYFKQFGKVTNVKVCRSSRTGRCKGYGYVEFAHPDVAKIAADTMNNYLMFKKRITAEFVPYEKRPKYLFIGKNTTLNRFSKKIRREKQRLASLKVDDKTHLKRTSSRLSKLHKKIERLQELGVKTTYTPENLAVIKQEDRHPSLNQIYPVEKTTEGTKVSRKKSSKSIEKIKSVVSLPENTKRKSTAVSKSKSLTAVKSSNKIGGGDQTTKVDVATSPSVKKNKKQKSKLTNGGIGKKSKQLAPLNSETVRKIARELIRKRGDSLLTYPVNVKDKLKKKSLKK